MSARLIVSCEHGGNRIPRPYAAAFAGADALLATHRGYDLGALEVAKRLATHLRAPLYGATVSRLLVDLNRSLGHPKLFFPAVKALDKATRARIVREHYVPHRSKVEGALAAAIKKHGMVLHLCVHSFTPKLNGEVRNTDVGLLYDPARPLEHRFARLWRQQAKDISPHLRVRFNYPYRGTSDGFTTHLRRAFTARRYAGVELELNQHFFLQGGTAWRRFVRDVEATLVATLRAFSG